ncbi:MAG: hypothetical protein A2W52_00640 [Candidatus Taylorbacteria bacterium RIFCSPHIGHO2_02_49_25]|uniref:Uncharacterized protein n=1 Tax=Candidatus Taylorbacteria bacterium RIFCSPHIGHO2_02_49_25 TaxID=1802305 RepID=A0A1G2MH86_9BACT|nr:MAG: hypothetical protein UY62_C0054G0004 [Parcubacteria group bacterium GW2011_GWF2_50_9]OHA19144.1 MAG: hypothetical protein A2759_00440 [Candidatus Taylorbacteria bacterium RIFCSPHIGHO2_01_FULL_49_60]OHA23276.1 MAG: hypothetical protein A2W52_00640 [Candidatus Taylorbacteria bacterium RIFCSPHIGHO2_02_49_25]OHA35942.1 MAG: hypothetical protein A3B27_01840 [Candidatus Taylorbacteria bacterium RIFCSPLOWO2_01_FULL_50_130]OHA36591.1 MAG: hypothetical protein A2W65_01025 [Candidatus Taylorbacte
MWPFLEPWIPVPRLREDKLHGNDADCVSSTGKLAAAVPKTGFLIEAFGRTLGRMHWLVSRQQFSGRIWKKYRMYIEIAASMTRVLEWFGKSGDGLYT